MRRPALWLAGFLACTGALAVSAQRARPAPAMADAARAFLAALEPAQRAKAVFPFNSEERMNWHFTPVARKGISLKELNDTQRQAALALLRAAASQKGFDQAAAVRELETVLHHQENRSARRDPELYFFTVFGEPSADGTWGWRYEGHHCSLNWTIVNGQSMASSPQFFGANPAVVRTQVPDGPAVGTRVLAGEEDLARKLLASLSEEQKQEAVIAAEAPRDIITGEQRQVAILEHKGIPYSKLTQEQQGMLLALIREYTRKQLPLLARQRMQKIRQAGMENVKFAWMGGQERGQGHYYRVQGPTFLIEYDNTQNQANHVHAVWRDFKGDWGTDLLAQHYQAFPHRVARAR